VVLAVVKELARMGVEVGAASR